MSINDVQPPQDDQSAANLPASVIFSEMMRRAAGQSSQRETGQNPATASKTADVLEGIVKENSAPPSEEMLADLERQHADAMEAQRIRRTQRRNAQRRDQTTGILGGLIRAFLLVIVSGGLIATILSWWTSPDSFPEALQIELGQIQPTSMVEMVVSTAIPTPNYSRRIGIISGHSGRENDAGAICVDDVGNVILTENEVNAGVASLVYQNLLARGYTVDLLEEWDHRLEGYEAELLVSIHANECTNYGELVTGFLVDQAEIRPPDGNDSRLVDCLAVYYAQATRLDRRLGTTIDMSDYHAFREISVTTPGAIIEIGFMLGDRDLITTQKETVARGIIDGILCYMEWGGPPLPTITPSNFATDTPTPEPEA